MDLHAHYYAALGHRELGNMKESEMHKAILKGLMDAIMENDGLSAKTAMISIGIAEQYFIMGYEGFRQESKSLENTDGSIFDVHTAVHPESGEKRKYYFNIDKVFGRF